jgi:hypothetical protein|tara:strand:- start:4512 stop:5861 length:1350 start_codon:yes stop_codon:yes gene_type:complete
MGLQGPDQAAVLSLNAIGQQDTYLLRNDPEHSFFKYDTNRHSNFTKFHKNVTISKPATASTTWPFGETVKVTLNPQNMGDLLSNMYIHMTFPAVDSNSNIADQIGRHVIESVAMRVDETEVDKYHDDWGIIYDELYLDASEKRTKRYTLNRNQTDNTSHLNDEALSRYKSELMIPIPLFFSRKYEGDEYDSNSPNRPYFPTCAIHKQKIEFEIKFRPMSFFTNNAGDLTLDTFNLITEEITVSPQERVYLMTKKQLFITDIAKKHPTEQTIIGENSIKLQLVPNIPVKSLFWFLRKEIYEDETAHGSPATPDANITTRGMSNRFNFSTSSSYSIANSFLSAVMDSAKIYINGQDLPNIPVADHNYFKYVVPHSCRLSRPNRNIYTYAFSMNPINVEPSGSLDFSKMNSDRTLLDIQLKPAAITDVYTLHLYYVGYQTFEFSNGFMSLAY